MRAVIVYESMYGNTHVVAGRASKGIAKRLHHHGFDVITDPESFLVDKESHLLSGEADRARAWRATLHNEASG